jgi:hypothetical protein
VLLQSFCAFGIGKLLRHYSTYLVLISMTLPLHILCNT